MRARERATELKVSSGASMAHGGVRFREQHRDRGRYRAKTRRERRDGLTVRSLVAVVGHGIDGGDGETRKFSSAVEEEDDGVGVLLLPGPVLAVEEVEEGVAVPSVGSAEPELLHGGVSTSTSLPVSLSVVQRRKGEQREGNGGGGGEGEGGEARVRGAAGEVVLWREKAARGPRLAVGAELHSSALSA